MTEYQQKVASKEFAGPQDSKSFASVADCADVTIRLWRTERPDLPQLNWQTESVLIYMIIDLITASSGCIDESSPMMTAHFGSSGQALVAAKRIQTSILEFLACRPGEYLGAAVLVHSLASQSNGPSGEIIRNTLRLAQPGQILLSEEISNRLRGIPGVDLRDVPGLATGGNENAGLSELLWITPGRIAELKASADAARRDEDSSVGATLIVNAPFASQAKTGQPKSAATRTTEETSGGVLAESGASRSTRQTSADFSTGAEDLLTGLEQSEQRPFFTRTTTLIAVAAVVLVGVLVWVFYPARTVPPVHVQGNQANTTENAGHPVPQTTTQPPIVEPQVPETPTNAPPAVVKTVTQVKPTDKHAKNVVDKSKDKASEPTPPPVIHVQGFEGMTQSDVPRLLQFAKSDAGNGNYERARKEYQVILQLQPNNAEAKEGLRKLDIAQSDRSR
jgi:hypothetical protein